MWEELEEFKKKKNLRCEWEWVKAHAGIEGNENVDQKANQEARMSHLSKDGNVNMVDVSDKSQTIRVAKAVSKIKLSKTDRTFPVAIPACTPTFIAPNI